MFLIYAILLSLFALAFVAYPFLRSKPEYIQVDRKSENLRAFNQQMSELKQAYDAGEFTDSEKEQLENELKLRLLEDTERADNPRPLQTDKPIVAIVLMTAALIVGSFAFYYSQGHLNDIELQEAYELAGTDAEAADRYLDLLAEKMERNPDDIEGWWVLGQTYLNAGMYVKAVPAYERALMALERLPEIQDQDRSALMTSIVQANFLVSDRTLTEENSRMLAQALKFDPQNRVALGISGSAAFESGNYAEIGRAHV